MEKNTLFQKLKIAAGLDDTPRTWLREKEIKELLRMAENDYPLTYISDQGIWCSSMGYFRLWEGDDGTRALVFAHEARDLDTYRHGAHIYPRHTGKVMLAKQWNAGENVTHRDIMDAAENYSEALHNAVASMAVLYRTDDEKRLDRSGPVFYQTHVADDAVDRIDFGWDLDDERMANPYGGTILERIVRNFEARFRINLLNHKRKSDIPVGARTPVPARAMNDATADDYIGRHFMKTLDQVLKGHHPLAREDRSDNRNYYLFMTAAQSALAFANGAPRGKRLRISADDAKAASDTFRSSTNLAQALLAKVSPVMAVISGAALLYQIYSTIKKARSKRMEASDRLMKYSWPSEYGGTLGTLLRPINPEAFSDGNMLQKPTFDAYAPAGIHAIESLSRLPHEMMDGETGIDIGTRIAFHRKAGAKPSRTPAKDVAAVDMRHANGIRKIKFLDDGSLWVMYDPHAAISPHGAKPHAGLLGQLKPGFVLEISPSATAAAAPNVRMMPDSEARQKFTEKCGKKLLGRFGPILNTLGITRVSCATSLTALLKQVAEETARRRRIAEEEKTKAELDAQAQRAEHRKKHKEESPLKLVPDDRKEDAVIVTPAVAAIEPFVQDMKMIEEISRADVTGRQDMPVLEQLTA
jgi:hypothetical protein